MESVSKCLIQVQPQDLESFIPLEVETVTHTPHQTRVYPVGQVAPVGAEVRARVRLVAQELLASETTVDQVLLVLAAGPEAAAEQGALDLTV